MPALLQGKTRASTALFAKATDAIRSSGKSEGWRPAPPWREIYCQTEVRSNASHLTQTNTTVSQTSEGLVAQGLARAAGFRHASNEKQTVPSPVRAVSARERVRERAVFSVAGDVFTAERRGQNVLQQAGPPPRSSPVGKERRQGRRSTSSGERNKIIVAQACRAIS